MFNKLLISLWIVFFGLLFLYSFTQIDLGLTLTRASFFQVVQTSFQYIGYFNRPLSTYLFIGVVLYGSVLYALTLYRIYKKKFSLRSVWILVILGSCLAFSYNAFSYDFFNYIFDAKIVTVYGENPYVKKALDYPADPMLGFMHWTHRTYPYGPVWLGITVPLSFVGMGYFSITFLLFKILSLVSYALSALLIGKICRKTKLTEPALAIAFFALSPFILIEGLVSAHIDLPMMVLALLGVYLLFVQKKYSAWIVLLVSAGVKFATIFLLPIFVWFPFSKRKHKEFIFILFSIILMCAGTYLQSMRTNFQPWYFLLVLPFAALLASRLYIAVPVTLFSLLVLLQYVPFLYTGNFDPPIPGIMNQMLYASIALSVMSLGIIVIYKKIRT